jgi:hypothetical protein
LYPITDEVQSEIQVKHFVVYYLTTLSASTLYSAGVIVTLDRYERQLSLDPQIRRWPSRNIHPYFFFFEILVCEAIGTAATPGLLCQPRVIVKMIVEKQMKCRLAGETEVLGEKLPSVTFVHHKIPHDQTRF